MRQHNYFIYIITNAQRQTIYKGITNDLERRLDEHYRNRGKKGSFAGENSCYYLVYWERFQYVNHAIDREKQIKGWKFSKKLALIESLNPQWLFLNDEIVDE
ncbi:GIY-YIG nuclease family protein [Microscilla marina]|uniref:Endonuclease n=1 Tax=Microscilla marina ATCC 23134 TaxID=313606 RepID=A1ZTE4_MICM2|nr:GIY-YIG nuclease family protein [Microscilla marina]EAY26366.1 endonuclease [Microscilla marina ATCC 23134]